MSVHEPLLRSISAIRTQHVEFVMPGGLQIELTVTAHRFVNWLLTRTNCAFGLLVLAIAASDALAYVLER